MVFDCFLFFFLIFFFLVLKFFFRICAECVSRGKNVGFFGVGWGGGGGVLIPVGAGREEGGTGGAGWPVVRDGVEPGAGRDRPWSVGERQRARHGGYEDGRHGRPDQAGDGGGRRGRGQGGAQGE